MESKHILMIDDDNDEYLLLRHAFDQHAPSVRLIWFDSPQAFLDALVWQQHPLDLIVLDLNLGGEAGKHWQGIFLSHICCQGVPTVIYSGSEAPGDRADMLAAGAVDFIPKVATAAGLRQVVDRMLTQAT
ncbi:response regulator transcription factor [Fibrella sp. HMF5335]|uniref:Response regulator transcription factor n=1 Tax=Fibrella rubiginis TaxID=2817060 RepID=A0A939GDR3_9BACT|nr:response regulator [Fibrella rubiginis]MBO0936481.1 response regulator transcription factor [Fibrella rubiginis]